MKQSRLQAWGNTKIIAIASCLVFNRDGQILLLQRHSEDLGGGMWGTPGGRLEPGEEPAAAAVRELREETALSLPNMTFLGLHQVQMPHGAVHMSTFTATTPGAESITIDPEEHHAYGWFKLEELLGKPNLLWGVPTVLRDFGFFKTTFTTDPTLSDGSRVSLIESV